MPQLHTKRDYSLLLIWITALVVGLLIYAPAIRFPLFWDDAPQFRWLVPIGPLEVWYSGQISSFYRPLPFTLFKLLWQLQGSYNPPTLHALAVAVHILNAALLGLLARRLTNNRWIGPVAAALFIEFPFDHQAVTWVTSLFHLMLVFGTLGAIMLGLRYLDRGSRLALIGAWLAAFIAIFSHENGVISPFLIATVLAAICYSENSLRASWRKLAWIVAPVVLITAVYMLIWMRIPKADDFGRGLQLAALDAKIAYVAQAIIYPISSLLRPTLFNGPAILIVLIASALIAVSLALVIAVRNSPNRKPFLAQSAAAILWIILAAAPAIVLLPSPYLLGSPRLLYFASVGVVLFWTVWLARVIHKRYLRLAGIAVISIFIAIGFLFNLNVMNRYARMSDFYWSFIDIAKTRANTPTLLVNAPSYIAPREDESTFLLGSEGATFLAYYLSLNDIVWVNTGVDYPVKTVGFDQTMTQLPHEVFYANPPWLNWDQLDPELAAAKAVDTVRFEGTRFFPVHVGDKLTASRGTLHAEYPSAILLDAYLEQNGSVLTLEWQSKTRDLATPFVHIICDGKLAAQFDGPPLAGIHPLDRWTADEMWSDHRFLGKPCVKIDSIEVGLYNPSSGARLVAHLPNSDTIDTIQVPLESRQ